MTKVSVFVSGLLFGVLQFFGEVLKLLRCFWLGRLLYRAGLRLFPKQRAVLLNGLADLHDRAGHFELARSAYEDAIKLEPRRSFHYLMLGSLFEKNGEVALAVQNYQAALKHGQAYAPEFRIELERRVAALAK